MSTGTEAAVFRLEIGDPNRGAGYVRNRHQTEPLPPEEFWRYAEKLPMQPPSLRVTGTTPLWSLRTVKITGHGWYRCFAVQGVGGPFGRAGACQFAFAPAQKFTAREFWQSAVAAILDDGRLGPIGAQPCQTPTTTEPDEHDQDRVRGVLLGVATNARLIPVDDGPGGAARAITGALRVLPDDESDDIVWWTCLLEPPTTSEHRHVTGQWPKEFRDVAPDPFRLVTRWMESRGPGPTDKGLTGHRASEALTVLAARAVNLRAAEPLPYSGLQHLTDILKHIAHNELTIRWVDVPEMLADEGRLTRLRAVPSVFGEYVRQRPVEAMKLAVESRLPRELASALLDTLAELSPPPHPEPVRGWHTALAGYLRVLYPDTEGRVDAVERLLIAQGGPLQERKHLSRAGRWLQSLGITPEDRPSLFPIEPGQISEELMRDGRIGEETIDRLSGHVDPHGVLLDVARHITLTTPGVTQALIKAAYQVSPTPSAADRAVALFCRLLDDGLVPRAERVTWLTELLRELRSVSAPDEVPMQIALEGVDRIDDELPDALLVEYLTVLAEDGERRHGERRVFDMLARRIEVQSPGRPSARWSSTAATVASRISGSASTEQNGGTRPGRSRLWFPRRVRRPSQGAPATTVADAVAEPDRRPATDWQRSPMSASPTALPKRTPPSHTVKRTVPPALTPPHRERVVMAAIAAIAAIAVLLVFALTGSFGAGSGDGRATSTAPSSPAPIAPTDGAPTVSTAPRARTATVNPSPTAPPAAGDQPGSTAPQGPAVR